MSGRNDEATGRKTARRRSDWVVAGCLAIVLPATVAAAVASGDHVGELASYFDHVQIAEPVVYRRLAVYPILLKDYKELSGDWLTLEAAVSRGLLEVVEKGGGGSVPVVIVENRSRRDYVFIMSGEVISGGKQTRTVRHDTVLAPGQRIELDVYCVEAHRWQGGKQFAAGKVLLPQSIRKELRKGADQQRVWSEVARNNEALQSRNATGSLELALKSSSVRKKLAEVQRSVMPRIPQGTVGFVFVDRGRAVGADFFGRDDLARRLLPKLLDSYAVDCVLLRKGEKSFHRPSDHRAAIDFFQRVRRAGSHRCETPGSGAGIRTRAGGLLGDGVSLGGTVVHYGVQIQDRIVPVPKPPKPIPLRQRRSLLR